MTQLNAILSIDLEGEDEDFKEWITGKLNEAMSQKDLTYKNSVVFLSFNLNNTKNCPTNNKIQSIILSEKAYDPNLVESDENLDSVVKFLRESILELYENHFNYELIEHINKKIQNQEYINDQASASDVWIGFMKSISDFTKWLTRFAQKCPGFHKFDMEDLTNLVYGGCLALYSLMYDDLCRDGDCYIVFENNVVYSNANIRKIYKNKNLANLVIMYFRKLGRLGLNKSEKALMHPFILLSCDETKIKAKDYMLDLKSYYINALINEFKANNRDDDFSKKLMDLFKVILVLEINKEDFKCADKDILEKK